MKKCDEKFIVDQILSGDRKMLKYFYDRYTPYIKQYINGKVLSEGDTEEILQDSLFAFLEALRDFNGKASLKTFFVSIAHNKVCDFYRKKKIASVVFSKFPKLYELVSPIVTPEESWDITEKREKITKVLQKLMPKYKQMLLLKYVEGLKVSEIANKFKSSLKSTEMTLKRARRSFVRIYSLT